MHVKQNYKIINVILEYGAVPNSPQAHDTDKLFSVRCRHLADVVQEHNPNNRSEIDHRLKHRIKNCLIVRAL